MKTVNYSFASNFVDFALSRVTCQAESYTLGLGLELVFGKVKRLARGSNWFCVNLLQNVLNFNPAMVNALGSDASICRCSASAGYPTML